MVNSLHHPFARLAVSACLFAFATNSALTATPSAFENPIELENRIAGTSSWRSARLADDKNMAVKGYVSSLSVTHGDTLRFFVSVKPAQAYEISIYRMGYYDGLGGRLVHNTAETWGFEQDICPVDSVTGMIECFWQETYALEIPDDWTTGVYLAKFSNQSGFDNYTTFVVRDDIRIPDFYYQQPVTTYHAYNSFPNDGERGKSTYNAFSHGPDTISGAKRAVRVSFDRPYEDSGARHYFRMEHRTLMFLEEHGYDIGYQTDIDLHEHPSRILRAKALISAGHDEYWTSEMYRAAEAARDAGVNLAFFGANAVYWQIRLEDGSDRRKHRVMEIYKDFALDPEPMPRKTVVYRSIDRPEQSLVGIQYATYGLTESDTDLIVGDSDHWIYQGTGLRNGDRIKGIVGIEVDTLDADFALPRHRTYNVLARSPYVGFDGVTVPAYTTIYEAESGAMVFATGTLLWGEGLSDGDLRSPGLRKMTNNLLDRFAGTEEPTIPELSLFNGSAVESQEKLLFVVKLSSPAVEPVSVTVFTRDNGTASQGPGEDFYGNTWSVTFSPGDTRIVLAATLIDNSVAEPDETFEIRMIEADGASISRDVATATIIDDD